MKWLFALPDPSLDELLSQVSRSFYFSLAVLPKALRRQLSVAYLVARAADTIADTAAVPVERRLELLQQTRDAINDDGGERGHALCGTLRGELLERLDIAVGGARETSGERTLLLRLDQCFVEMQRFEVSDRERTRAVLATLIEGMERDLRRFPGATTETSRDVKALATVRDLDEHCYFAAGCVGEYWTKMTAAHCPGLERLARPDFIARGIRLGKALQYVNVLRDAPRDLQQGRSYIPVELLTPMGLLPIDLRDPQKRRKARPIFDLLLERAVAHVDAAMPYVLAIPRSEPRLRLAALWPIWIGLGTLALLKDMKDPFDPTEVVRIPQNDLYKILAESTAVVSFNTALERSHARRRAAV